MATKSLETVLENNSKVVTSSVKVLLEQTNLRGEQIGRNEVVTAVAALKAALLEFAQITNGGPEEVACTEATRTLMAVALKVIGAKTKGLQCAEDENQMSKVVDQWKLNFGSYIRFARKVLESAKPSSTSTSFTVSTVTPHLSISTFTTGGKSITIVSSSDTNPVKIISDGDTSDPTSEEAILRRRSAPRPTTAVSKNADGSSTSRRPPRPVSQNAQPHTARGTSESPKKVAIIEISEQCVSLTPDTEISTPIGPAEPVDTDPNFRNTIVKKNTRILQTERRASESALPRKCVAKSPSPKITVDDGTRPTVRTPPRSPLSTSASPHKQTLSPKTLEIDSGPKITIKQAHRKSEKLPRTVSTKKVSSTINPQGPGKQLSEKAQAEMDAILAMLGEN